MMLFTLPMAQEVQIPRQPAMSNRVKDTVLYILFLSYIVV